MKAFLRGAMGGLFGAMLQAFDSRRERLDAERDQHHLASMLISVSGDGDDVSEADIRRHLDDRGYSSAQRTVRINHAVGLAGTVVTGTNFDAVVALARKFAR